MDVLEAEEYLSVQNIRSIDGHDTVESEPLILARTHLELLPTVTQTVPTECIHRLGKWRFGNLVMSLPDARKVGACTHKPTNHTPQRCGALALKYPMSLAPTTGSHSAAAAAAASA